MSDSQICVYDDDRGFKLGQPSEVAAAIFHELEPSMVYFVHDGEIGGSGWALDGHGHVATDMHVALHGRRLEVQTPSGKKLDGFVEKIDVFRDLAIIKVPGLAEAGVKPAKIDTGSVSHKDVVAIGSPQVASPKLAFDCMSEGKIKETTSWYYFIGDASREWAGRFAFLVPRNLPEPLELYRQFLSGNVGADVSWFVSQNGRRFEQAAQQWLTATQIESGVFAASGQSGGVLATKSGVVGILQEGYLTDDPKTPISFAAPVNNAVALNASSSRLSFYYDENHRLQKIESVKEADTESVAEADLANVILATLQKNIDANNARKKGD